MSVQMLKVFESYQKARISFIQQIGELSNRSANVECMVSAGAVDLVQPMLADPVANIRQGAALALGRMAEHDRKAGELIGRRETLELLLKDLEKQNKYYKTSALFVLRAISKHGPEISDVIIECGGLQHMLTCLEDFEQSVKKSAAYGIGYLVKHSESLAQAVVNAGTLPLLILSLKEPDLCLKQIAAWCLVNISKHCEVLATTVAEAGAIPHLVKALRNTDPNLKRDTLKALANIAKPSVNLAELIVEAEIFPDALIHLAHPNDEVKKSASFVVLEVVKHTLELAKLVVDSGGVAALLEMISCTQGSTRLQAIMALGFIGSQSNQLALAVLSAKTMVLLDQVLNEETDDLIRVAVVWTIGQCGKYSPEHASYVSSCELLPKILLLHLSKSSSEKLKSKTECALKQVLSMTLHSPTLEALLNNSPPTILRYVLAQLSKILPNDPKARRNFVSSGALKQVQEMTTDPEFASSLLEYINIVNSCFPEEIVRYFSPNYPDDLLEKVEQYVPKIDPLLTSSRTSSEDVFQDACKISDE